MTTDGSLFSWLRSLGRNMLRRRASDADLTADVQSFVELLTDEKTATGMNPEEARRAALLELGGIEATKEATRAVRAGALLAEFVQDARYAARMARRERGFTTAAVLTLALGIGANTAVFSVVNAVLLRPLPYRDSERVVMLHNRDADGTFGVSDRERLIHGAQPTLFASFSTYQFAAANLIGLGEAKRLVAVFVDANLFTTLGVVPTRGRVFVAEDDRAQPTTTAIISHELWTDRFGADDTILGRAVTLNGLPRTIVGILPAGFRLPGNFLGEAASVYLPRGLVVPDPRNIHYLEAVARLAPGLSLPEANAQVGALATRIKEEIGSLPPTYSILLVPVDREVFGDVRPGLGVITAAVGLLLLIACGNLATLLLARAQKRRAEIGLRTALGASRGRIVRQMLTESVLLALAGGIVGVALAWIGARALVLLDPELPRIADVSVDGNVLLFTATLSVFSGLLFGIIPARLQSREGLLSLSLAGAARGSTSGRLHARRPLVAGQVALLVTLAIGAGLLARSARHLAAVPPGFDATNVLTMRLTLPLSRYPDTASMHRYYQRLLDDVRALPGVITAGAVTDLPMASNPGDWGLMIDGLPERLGNGRRPFADWIVASDSYFEAMTIPLLEGRTFRPSDMTGSLPVVIINRRMARDYWPGGSPLGGRLRMTTDIDPVYRTIIGVVGDVRHDGLEAPVQRQIFLPRFQFPAGKVVTPGGMTVVVRAAGNRSALTGALRARVAEIDRDVPIAELRTMREVLEASTSVMRMYLLFFGVFSTLALTIVCVGIYGVSSYIVAAERRALAIRRVLGASGASVVVLVLREGAVLALMGTVAGVLASLALAGVMSRLLFGVSSRDPVTFFAVPILIVIAAIFANLLPARRAVRESAFAALRAE
jgi:putative ABC transport system permease protein